MRRIAIACEKGGVGKTSLTVGLACALAHRGRRVLVIDCDGQAAATQWLGHEHAPGLTRVFQGHTDLLPLVRETCAPRVGLVPASNSLLSLERTLGDVPDGETFLRDALARLPRRWDYVLLDSPPSLGLIVVAALSGVHELFIPAEARPMGLPGLSRVLATARRVRSHHNPELAEARIVLSRTQRTRLSQEAEATVRERFGSQVFETTIPERVSVARAAGLHLPVTRHDPTGSAARAFFDLAAEVQYGPRRRSAKSRHTPLVGAHA